MGVRCRRAALQCGAALVGCGAALVAGLLLCVGCGSSTPHAEIFSPCDLNAPSRKVAVMTGVEADKVARAAFPRAQFCEYPMPIDAFTALCARKVDGVVLDRPSLEFMALAHPELKVLSEDLATGNIVVGAARTSTALMARLNAFIRRYRADGTYAAMVARWFHTVNPAMPTFPAPTEASAQTPLRVGVTANNQPLCYVKDGALAGFDAEFAQRFAADLKRAVAFVDIPYDALVPALKAGRIDIAVAYMDAMPERAEEVLFSENYVDAPIAVLVHRADASEAVSSSVLSSFEKTFIRESRWLLIVRGLALTLLITALSVLLGTLLSFPLCRMSRSKVRACAWLANEYTDVIMGTPILVILMILYYIVFARVDVSGVVVAVIGFAMEFAAYNSVALRAGVESVPRGQFEAGLALGHSPWQTYVRFILPQAIRTMLPVYRSEIISTLKSTSIVGYIAIMDLTKMGDIIRSRTYEAFFPLLAIAVLYFLSAKCLTKALIALERRLAPAVRRDRLQKRSAR